MHLLIWYESKERNQQLLEEVDKPEEKLSILANESDILSMSFVVISTIFDKAVELKDGLVIKKSHANGNSFFCRKFKSSLSCQTWQSRCREMQAKLCL